MSSSDARSSAWSAFLRPSLWDPASWAPGAVPSRARIARALGQPEASLEALLEEHYGPRYAERLYRD